MDHHDEGARAEPEDVPELCGAPGHELTPMLQTAAVLVPTWETEL